MKTKVINLYGGPGTGKSTTAAGVFYHMKKLGLSVELVTEFAKDCVYEERQNIFKDQLYILAKQNRRLLRLKNKVSYIVTDSPLLLGHIFQLYYKGYDETLLKMIQTCRDEFENIDIFINRTKQFKQEGRNESEQQAKDIDNLCLKVLNDYEYFKFTDDNYLINNILTVVL